MRERMLPSGSWVNETRVVWKRMSQPSDAARWDRIGSKRVCGRSV